MINWPQLAARPLLVAEGHPNMTEKPHYEPPEGVCESHSYSLEVLMGNEALLLAR